MAEDIERWADQTTQSMSTLSISSPRLTRPRPMLEIPLDDDTHATRSMPVRAPIESVADDTIDESGERPAPVLRRKRSNRDSLVRREALLKGKEGTRRRQRWENDHLLHVPNAEPPLPSDWQVPATHPTKGPYYLAPLWTDQAYRLTSRRSMATKSSSNGQDHVSRTITRQEQVSRDLKDKLKKSRGAKALLQDLESQIRDFVQRWESTARQQHSAGRESEFPVADSEDEEIVFVGRNGGMSDEFVGPETTPVQMELESYLKVFESLADDRGGNFCRYLIHSIGVYYDLDTWSITTGNPARREAYVGIPSSSPLAIGGGTLPRPLWGVI